MTEASPAGGAGPRWMRRVRAGVLFAMLLALALPPAAVPHGDHPPSPTDLPAVPAEPAADESDGGTSGVLVGGVAAGMIALAGGLIVVRERQRRTAPAGRTATQADPATRDPKQRTRRSW